MERRESRKRQNALRRILEIAPPRYCWANPHGRCASPIIDEHSIQEAILDRIANRRGKVITVMPRNFGAATNPNREKFTEIDAGKASIGSWSCKSDDHFFQVELEDREPNWKDPRHNLLLTLRAFLYRNWLDLFELGLCKVRAEAIPSEERELMKEADFVGQRQRKYQTVVDLLKKLVDNRDYSYLRYRTREVAGSPILACSTAALMQLQGSPAKDESFMSVTIYPSHRGHVVSVAYPEEDKVYIEASFHAFSFESARDFEEAISEFVLINPYNTFISPDHWQKFSTQQRETIFQQVRAHEGLREVNRLIVPPPSAISMFNLFRVLH